MAKLPGGGGGGSDGSSSGFDVGTYVGFNTETLTFRLDLLGLFGSIGAALLYAAFYGFIATIEAIGTALAMPYQALSSFLTDLIVAVFGAQGVIQAAVVAARADIIASGIAGFAVAVAVAAATLYVASLGVRLLG